MVGGKLIWVPTEVFCFPLWNTLASEMSEQMSGANTRHVFGVHFDTYVTFNLFNIVTDITSAYFISNMRQITIPQ